MIVTILEVSSEFAKNGAEYKKVKCATTEGRETTKSIFDSLKASWGLLEENAVLDFEMEKRGQFWNVVGIKPVGLKPPTEPTKPTILPEHQEEIDIALEEAGASQKIAPQAIGMCTKELGDMYRAGKLSEIFGHEAAIELVKWYRGQVLAITRIEYDGMKLPNFKKKVQDAKRETKEEQPPED